MTWKVLVLHFLDRPWIQPRCKGRHDQVLKLSVNTSSKDSHRIDKVSVDQSGASRFGSEAAESWRRVFLEARFLFLLAC